MTEHEYIAELEKITGLIKQFNNNAEIVFLSPWITLDNDAVSVLEHNEKLEMIDEYSEQLKLWADKNGHMHIDPTPYIIEFFHDKSSRVYTKDGIHPTAEIGVELYSKAVLESSE